MYEKGQIILYGTQYGIVKDDAYNALNTFTIVFDGGKEVTLRQDNKMVSAVSIFSLNELSKHNFYNYLFAAKEKQLGRDIIKNNQIKAHQVVSPYLHNFEIATSTNQTINLKINLTNGKLFTSCSCSNGAFCEHCYAGLNSLNDKISSSVNKKNQEYISSVKGLTDIYNAYSFYLYIKSLSKDEIVKLVTTIVRRNEKNAYELIILFWYFDEELKKQIPQDYLYLQSYGAKSIINEINNRRSRYASYIKLYQNLISKKYIAAISSLIDVLGDRYRYSNTDPHMNLFNLILKQCQGPFSDDDLFIISRFIDFYTDKKNFFDLEPLFAQLDEEQKQYLCEHIQSYLDITSPYFKYLTPSKRIECLYREDEDKAIEYVKNHFQDYQECYPLLLDFLFFLVLPCKRHDYDQTPFIRKKQIRLIVKEITSNSLVNAVFTELDGFISDHYYYCFHTSYKKIERVEDISPELYQAYEKLNSNFLKIRYQKNQDDEEFREFFEIHYKIEETIPRLDFFLTFKGGERIICYGCDEGKNFFPIVELEYEKLHLYNYQSKYDFQVKFANLSLNYLIDVYGEEIVNNFNSLKQLVKDLTFQKQQKTLNAYLANYTKIKEDDVYTSLVKLIPDIADNENIKLKIGMDKMYAVPSVDKLLVNIAHEADIKLGNKLTFKGRINNFNPTSKELINFLANSKLVSKSNSLEPSLFLGKYLARLYDNQIIYYHGEAMKMEKINFKVKYRIDEEGHIHLDLPQNIISEAYFFIDTFNKIVYSPCEDEELASFTSLLSSIPNSSISHNLDQFKYSFYLNHIDNFELEGEMKEKLNLGKFKIKGYFSFDDKKIVVENKYFLENVPCAVGKLNKEDLKVYDKYQNILFNYGFRNDQLTDNDDIINFLRSDLSLLRKISNVYLSDEIMNAKTYTYTKPNIRINYENGFMNVFLENSSYTDEELRMILTSLKRNKKYVLLRHDRIIELNEDTKKTLALINDMNLDIDHLSETKHVPLHLIFKTYAYDEKVSLDDYLSSLLNDITNFKTAPYQIPPLNAELRPYQVEGYKWLKTLEKYHLGGILADDMGLGKTLEVIALLTSSKTKLPTLIVCPKSLIYNWKNEFARFAPSSEVIPLYGNADVRKNLIKDIAKTNKIYITSYDSLRSDIDLYENIKFNYCILDEAQVIKNVIAQKTKSVKKLKANYRIVLTGTPIENNIIDLWSIFDFIMPGYLPLLNDFKGNYEKDEDNYTSLIYKKVAPFILRRTKKEVLKDLPEKVEMVMTCEMEEQQNALYQAEKLHARDILNSGGQTFDVLFLLTRLRQLCVDPSLYIATYTEQSAKMALLKSLIKEYLSSGHRLIIFSQFVKALNIVEKYLNAQSIDYYMITGETPAEKRIEYCDKFNQFDEVPICLVSLKAGGTGLNLVGADIVIHLDPWWNNSVMDQATDRAYRIGQTKNVEVIKLICENSIEQKVIELQEKKKNLIDKIISNDDSSITSLSQEDLKFILE